MELNISGVFCIFFSRLVEGVNDSLHVLVADNIAFFRTNAVKSVFFNPIF